jgi:hypothetical protein
MREEEEKKKKVLIIMINNCEFVFSFCIGDRFYLYDNRILCEYDYEELIMFGGSSYNSLDRLKKQTESLASPPNNRQGDDASSGYGSPDSLLSDGK